MPRHKNNPYLPRSKIANVKIVTLPLFSNSQAPDCDIRRRYWIAVCGWSELEICRWEGQKHWALLGEWSLLVFLINCLYKRKEDKIVPAWCRVFLNRIVDLPNEKVDSWLSLGCLLKAACLRFCPLRSLLFMLVDCLFPSACSIQDFCCMSLERI